MDELQVYFCDLCNASVPEQDLDSGQARRVRDKVVGGCCLVELDRNAVKSSSTAPAEAVRSGPGGFSTALVVLVAIAGATLLLDWRFAEETAELRSAIAAVRGDVEPLRDQFVRIEKQISGTLRPESLAPLESSLGGVAGELPGLEERVVASVRDNATRLRELGTQITALDAGQRDQSARIAEMRGEFRRVADQVGDLAANARIAAQAAVPPLRDPADAGVNATDGGAIAAEPAGLPAGLMRFVGQLSDPDDGARFEAVDELLQSGDTRVFSFVLPLAADPDPFVRRLVFEGLKDHRAPESVDALIQALGDTDILPRYTAYASLKVLTAQDFPFDPEATAAKRASMQRRWQEWWSKNRDGLFG